MLEREKELLKIARERMGRLPGDAIDILIVDQIGKDISGDGADPNVINRDVSGELAKSEIIPKPEVQRVIFRDLTPDTEGNATGVGLGDFVLRQLADKINPTFTYMNVITSKYPSGGRLPMVVDNDRQALYLAIGSAFRTQDRNGANCHGSRTRRTSNISGSPNLWPPNCDWRTGRIHRRTDGDAVRRRWNATGVPAPLVAVAPEQCRDRVAQFDEGRRGNRLPPLRGETIPSAPKG